MVHDQLELDSFWRPRLRPSREGTPWLKVLKTSGDHLREVMKKDVGVDVEIYQPDQLKGSAPGA